MNTCTHPNDERYFTDDSLIEFCGLCGEVVTDHHERKFGEPHPEHFPRRGRGRPRFDPAAPTVRTTIRLTPAQVAKAEQLGNGNVAQGVRQAIEDAEGKCEHCGNTGNVKKIVIEDGFIWLCGACRGDARTTEYNERKTKSAV